MDEMMLEQCLYCKRNHVAAASITTDIRPENSPVILFTSALMCVDCASLIARLVVRGLAEFRTELVRLEQQRGALTVREDKEMSPPNSHREVEKFLRDLGFSF